MSTIITAECPCGSKNSLATCCGRFLSGHDFPKTAEELMRARYTAFTLVDLDFIQKTFSPKNHKDFDFDATRKWAEESQWKSLEIIAVRSGGPHDSSGTVEFTATYEHQGQTWVHHETSQFRRDQAGHWSYVDGKSSQRLEGASPKTQVRSPTKVGRNDTCSCGSGKKYKKCCGQG